MYGELGATDGSSHSGRWSQLTDASLRVHRRLEFDAMLQVALESAVELVRANYGVLALIDDVRGVGEFLTSGLDADLVSTLGEAPDVMRFYEHLGSADQPLRTENLTEYLEQNGLTEIQSPVPPGAFLSLPIRIDGENVGFIYLSKDDGEPAFDSDDQEILLAFSAQVAVSVVNARLYREELRSRADLETLVNTAPVGVMVFDATKGAVKLLNREALRIAGELTDSDGSIDELLGVLSFRRPGREEVSLQEFSLARALSSGQMVRGEEIVLSVPDGKSVTILVNATPIRSDSGHVESYVVVLQDVAPLTEIGSIRADFLAMVSHELRTPLTSIKGSATTLLDNGTDIDPTEMRQFHRIIAEQTDHMRGLINDLLDVAHVQTGTLSVTPEPSDLSKLVDEARNSFLRDAGRGRLEIGLDSELPKVMVDRRRIVQVLGNLLSNAVRYSAEASAIGVSARLDGLHVEVSVWDRGRGISAEQLPQLFVKYARIDAGMQGRGLPGSGLGLAICKGIVEAHGGRIWAESPGEGLGARFTFTIPVAEDITDTATAASRANRSGRGRTRVLVVDDDPMALHFIRDALNRADYHMVGTTDPQDVPDLIEIERPHLVLLDLVLDGSNGIDLMQSILSTSNVPVIFVSAYGEQENVIRALDMGAVDYVVKPFSASELVARIRAALRQQAGSELSIQQQPFVLDDLSINYAERRVTLSGNPVTLTATEYAVLHELATHAGMVLTHDQLLVRVWGVANSGDAGLVRTIIRRIRKKLNDDARNPCYILTEPRVGYRMRRREPHRAADLEP